MTRRFGGLSPNGNDAEIWLLNRKAMKRSCGGLSSNGSRHSLDVCAVLLWKAGAVQGFRQSTGGLAGSRYRRKGSSPRGQRARDWREGNYRRSQHLRSAQEEDTDRVARIKAYDAQTAWQKCEENLIRFQCVGSAALLVPRSVALTKTPETLSHIKLKKHKTISALACKALLFFLRLFPAIPPLRVRLRVLRCVSEIVV